MQFKDGTVVVNSEGGEYQEQGEFTQNELPVEYDENTTAVGNQTNQLSARLMVGMLMGVKPVVAPVRPAVVPHLVRPQVVVPPKPIPRGSIVRPG